MVRPPRTTQSGPVLSSGAGLRPACSPAHAHAGSKMAWIASTLYSLTSPACMAHDALCLRPMPELMRSPHVCVGPPPTRPEQPGLLPCLHIPLEQAAVLRLGFWLLRRLMGHCLAQAQVGKPFLSSALWRSPSGTTFQRRPPPPLSSSSSSYPPDSLALPRGPHSFSVNL